MGTPLSKADLLLAEICATKIVTMCLAHLYLETLAPNQKQAAKKLLLLAQNTAEQFRFSGGGSPNEQAAVREAMNDRIEQIILSAANPGQLDKDRRP